MRILLDTHVLIWWDAGHALSKRAVNAIQNADEVFVSSAAAWEVAIKASLGKIASKRSIAIAASESGFTELPITFAHADKVRDLPAHHRDPFDRLMIAQAQVEGLVIVSRDRSFGAYDVPVIVG